MRVLLENTSFLLHKVIKIAGIIRHTGYIEVIMQRKCGRNTETTFDIKWVIGTYGNWKNLNPGGRFGATS